jgi:hypothetical protein
MPQFRIRSVYGFIFQNAGSADMRGIFISKLHAGRRFVASRSRKGLRTFIWTEVRPDLTSEIIAASEIPMAVRRQAYRWLGKAAP